jgi:uncharacterized protein (TIGR03437 family)
MKAALVFVALTAPLAAQQASRRAFDLSELRVPPGFQVSIYARGLGSARLLAFSPTGVLFVSDSGGRIRAVPQADRVVTFASGLRQPHGLAFRGDDLYVAENHRIIVFRNATHPSLTGGSPEFVADLPSVGGGHSTRTILWDSEGRLIATAGSTCNICNESDPRRAAAMRFQPDGSGMEIFARGLRNTVGIAVHPLTGEIWSVDNGGDNLGDNLPPEEVNILRAGQDYGWPRCYGDGGRYPGFSGDCSSTTPPELNMQAHSAPLGLGFYTGDMFPAGYRNDAFVGFHGSWNRSEPTGYKVVRILASSGRATGSEDFLTGFLNGRTTSGRPVHAITGPDGALYVSDDMNGFVYRVSYNGPRVNPDGVVSAAAPQVRAAAGSLVSLYGTGFREQAARATSLPLPTRLEDVQVKVDGVPAPLLYVGPQQINFQMPFGVQGRVTVEVSSSRATDTIEIDVSAAAPAIFTQDQSGTGLAALRQSGRVLEIYCTGLGAVSPPLAAGAAAPASPLARVTAAVAVSIDGRPAEVSFAGLTPGFAGLYQVNAVIPAGVRTGQRVNVTVTAGGAASNTVEAILN